MKLINFLIITLCFFFTSCNDEDFWEISSNSSIEYKVDNIAFQFCLVDENENPSTKFRKGEYFSFYFKMTNLSEHTIIIDANFFTDDFFMVYNRKNKKVGKPWTGAFCAFSLDPRTIEILPKESKTIQLPWYLNLHSTTNENFHYSTSYPFCKVLDKESVEDTLYVGEYTCKFPIDLLIYTKNGKEEKINNLFFAINFKIE